MIRTKSQECSSRAGLRSRDRRWRSDRSFRDRAFARRPRSQLDASSQILHERSRKRLMHDVAFCRGMQYAICTLMHPPRPGTTRGPARQSRRCPGRIPEQRTIRTQARQLTARFRGVVAGISLLDDRRHPSDRRVRVDIGLSGIGSAFSSAARNRKPSQLRRRLSWACVIRILAPFEYLSLQAAPAVQPVVGLPPLCRASGGECRARRTAPAQQLRCSSAATTNTACHVPVVLFSTLASGTSHAAVPFAV